MHSLKITRNFGFISILVVAFTLAIILGFLLPIESYSQFPYLSNVPPENQGNKTVVGINNNISTAPIAGNLVQKNSGVNNGVSNNNKVAILTFGDGFKSQYLYAKPILDKYGFKGNFFITCNFVGSENSRMNWQDIETLHNQGHYIGSKTVTYKNLNQLSANALNFEVGQSKQCLQAHGINATVFATPQGIGWNNATVINTIAKYYDFAINGFSNLMYLHCDGWKRYSSQTDCRTYFDNGTLTYANRYSIKEWSHRHIEGSQFSSNHSCLTNCYFYDNSQMLEKFIVEVNSQIKFNNNNDNSNIKNGTVINAIPIIAYHNFVLSPDMTYNNEPTANNVSLFDQEMKYLHENGFKVLTMADIGYDDKSNYIYIKR